MQPLLVFPENPPAGLKKVLAGMGVDALAVGSAMAARSAAPADGWSGAIIVGSDAEAIALCRELRKGEDPIQPLMLIVDRDRVSDLDMRDDLYDDFLCADATRKDPIDQEELEIRIRHLFWRSGHGTHPGLVEYGPLKLNLETYQAVLEKEPLDLTFMEYELLKFFATHPGKVFSREVLLSRVWGYDYYGGARTVDVHVRRLRAKLGEEHAGLIQTVRSVGYRFGQSKWLSGI